MTNTFAPNTSSASGLPAGAVIPYGGSAAPTGWLLCYGQAVSRATYADLFTIISTTFGTGDGSTTFNLPDLRGRTAAGKDDMGGSAANRLTSTVMSPDGNTVGAVGGAQTVTLDTTMIPAHAHTQNAHDHDLAVNTSGVSDTGFGGSTPALNNSTAGGSTIGRSGSDANNTVVIQNSTATNQNTGGGAAHSNTQPSMILNYIIKT